MGFLKGLLGLGVTAGAAFAALKVAQKYEENKAAEAQAAADGAQPEDFDDPGVMGDVLKAVGDVATDAGRRIKQAVTGAAEKAGVDTDALGGAFAEAGGALHEAGSAVVDAGSAIADAGSAVVDAGSAVAGYVAGEAPAVADRLRDGAEDLLDHVKEAVASRTPSGGHDEEGDAPAGETEAAPKEADKDAAVPAGENSGSNG